jgi:hypothetical protein
VNKWWQDKNNFTPEKEFNNDKPFKTRFDRIFGVDGVVGTMSAGNLLYTIPIELFGKIPKISDNSTENEDYLSFIVLGIFNTMFNKNTNNKQYEQVDENTTLSDTYLCGLLRKFYSSPNVKFVGYYDDKKDFYIFSHGGITDKLLNCAQEKDNCIVQLRELIKQNENKITFNNISQSGGDNIDVKKSFTKQQVIWKLNSIQDNLNNLLKTSLEIVPCNEIIPDDNMLLLMALSAPYKPSSDEMRFIYYSTINPGVINLKNNFFTISDSILYQIIGHVPKGYGPTLLSFINGNNKSYLINLDISQSFKYSGDAGKTNVYLSYKNNEMKLNYSIDTTNIKDILLLPENTNKEDIYKVDDTLKNLFIEKENFENIQDYKENEFIKGKVLYFHGVTKINNYLHYLITISDRETSFDKKLFIYKKPCTDDNEFYFGFDNELCISFDNLNGGYKQKYLKYKQKYLQLKNLFINKKF